MVLSESCKTCRLLQTVALILVDRKPLHGYAIKTLLKKTPNFLKIITLCCDENKSLVLSMNDE